MLEVEKYLGNGKSFEDLSEFGIKATFHPESPLVILNYDQIDSPKTHPIVRECRGIVLDTNAKKLVARSFPRFFNWGEVADELTWFNWNKVSVQEKVDGSLVLIYSYMGQWFANTRGSFANAPILNKQWEADYHNLPISTTWKQAFCKALNISDLQELDNYLNPSITYICEFCSPWNKVVRTYPKPTMFLLSTFEGEQELGVIDNSLFTPVNTYNLNNVEQISDFLNAHPESTFEGVVVKDDANRRWKIKNARYVSLHRMKGNNSEELGNPKNLLPYILAAEGDELLTYFPEIKNVYNAYKDKVLFAYKELEAIYNQTKGIQGQKEFALSIVGKTPFTSILFTLRKEGKDDLKKIWSRSENVILKVLFGK